MLLGLVMLALMRSTDVFKYLIVALNWQAVFTTGVGRRGAVLRGIASRRTGEGGRPRRAGRLDAGRTRRWSHTGLGAVRTAGVSDRHGVRGRARAPDPARAPRCAVGAEAGGRLNVP